MRSRTSDTDREVRGDRSEDHVDPVSGETASRWVKTGTGCAIGLGATLLACTVIIATGHARHTTSAPASPASSESGVVVPRPDTSDSAAGTPAPSPSAASTGTATAPQAATWQQIGLGALPFSPTAGPTRVVDGVPTGFADSSQGAVIAACQILGRLSWAATDTAAMRAIARTMTTPSAQALAAVTYRPPTDASLIPQIAGFQILSYTPTSALINLALRFHASLRAAPASLVWSDGDWRLAGAPGPLAQTSWAALEDLTGYVLFSGQPGTPVASTAAGN